MQGHMHNLFAAWIVAASIYHAKVLDPAHGARMPLSEAIDIAQASTAHPLYEGPLGPIRTAALLIIFSASESLHTPAAPYQDTDHQTRGGPFGTTYPYTATHALEVMHYSAKRCPAHPLATYAGGCDYPSAQAIADERACMAELLLVASGISSVPPSAAPSE